MKQHFVVTGASGFIGRHVAEELQSRGNLVTKVDRSNGIDLTDWSAVKSLPDCDIVLHFAAVNSPAMFSQYPMSVVRTNVLSTQYLLDRYAGQTSRFVLASSSESYAGSRDYFNVNMPTDETVPLCIENINEPRSCYGGSKLTNELQVTAAGLQTGMPYTIIRYHNVYGPGQDNQFIPDFIKRALSGDLSLHGGDNTRTYLYIQDAVNATLEIAKSDKCVNQILNLGGSQIYSIRYLAQTIQNALGINQPLIDHPGGVIRHRQGDITKLKQLINFEPTIQLEEGIARTIAHIKNLTAL